MPQGIQVFPVRIFYSLQKMSEGWISQNYLETYFPINSRLSWWIHFHLFQLSQPDGPGPVAVGPVFRGLLFPGAGGGI
jgi:hypothetical protein